MNPLHKIRMGLLLAQIKMGGVHTQDASYPKDPNPENWRTISGAKVHLTNGKIDGGAGGKFKGNVWKGKKAHGLNSFSLISELPQKVAAVNSRGHKIYAELIR